jgi:hypothetical protein
MGWNIKASKIIYKNMYEINVKIGKKDKIYFKNLKCIPGQDSAP